MKLIDNKQLDYNISYELLKILYQKIQSAHLLSKLDESKINTEEVTEFRVWLTLREVYVYFMSIDIEGFDYKADDFIEVKSFSVEEIFSHLHGIYELSVDYDITDLVLNSKQYFSGFMVYLQAFLVSLFESKSFAMEYECSISNFAEEEFSTDLNTIDMATAFFLDQTNKEYLN